MRTLVLLMAALFLAAGLASAPAQAIGVQKEMKVGFIYRLCHNKWLIFDEK